MWLDSVFPLRRRSFSLLPPPNLRPRTLLKSVQSTLGGGGKRIETRFNDRTAQILAQPLLVRQRPHELLHRPEPSIINGVRDGQSGPRRLHEALLYENPQMGRDA